MFTQPSAPFSPVATNSAYDTSYFGQGGGGSNLPPGADGAYLFFDGTNWVAQNDPIIIGPGIAYGGPGNISIGPNVDTASANQSCIGLGSGATVTNSASSSMAIGDTATVSADYSVVIGSSASSGGNDSVVIGVNATVGLSPNSVSIGPNAGHVNNSKDGNISIGSFAGNAGGTTQQGTYAINIGVGAGQAGTGSFDSSIVLNASGAPTSAIYSSLYVNPVLASTMTNYLSYDPVSKLVGYGQPTAGTPSFSLITQGATFLNTFGASNVNEFTIASGDLNSVLPSGHSYLITFKVTWDLVQNPADSNFTTALTSNSFINPLFVYGSGASPTTYASVPLFSTNYVGSNSYFGGNVGGTFASAWDTTLSGIATIPFNATMASYFILQFTSATYTAPASNVNINQFSFTAVQLT